MAQAAGRVDPGKSVLDNAVDGGFQADIGVLRADSEAFGSVTSDPNTSRLVGILAVATPVRRNQLS